MSNYVLVAGNLPTEAWNRLTGRNDYTYKGYLGGKIWNQVIPALESQGHSIFAPTLKNEETYSLSDQIEEISQLILQYDLKKVILVGASYCGMVITGVANKISDRIDLLVYLDAVLPEPGQSVADIFKSAHFFTKMPIENSPTYTEELHFDPQKIQLIPKLYVLCTESNFTSVTSLAKQIIAKDEVNWTYTELATSHLSMVTHPDELTRLLLSVKIQYSPLPTKKSLA